MLNKDNKVFVAKRIDNPKDFWQMPQGGVDKDERSLSNERMQIEQLHIDMEDERFILETSFEKNLKSLLSNQVHVNGIEKLSKNSKITQEILDATKLSKLKNVSVKDDAVLKQKRRREAAK